MTNAYHIRWGSFTPDSEKTWDRRWGKIFLGKNQVEFAASVIYDDDVAAWTALLEEAVTRLKKQKARTAYYSSNFAEILARAFTNKHPQARAYYDKFIDLGFPAEDLAFILEAEGKEA
jgi:hypothetical protein